MKKATERVISFSTDNSPARKRMRRDPSVLNDSEQNDNWRLQRWSITKNDMLDSAKDIGVGPLESDTEEPLSEEIYSNYLSNSAKSQILEEDDETLATIMQFAIPKEAFTTFTSRECKELLIHKAENNNIFKINHFQQLSDEVVLHIFRCLPKSSLANAALVCHRWYQLAQDETLWSRMDLSSRSLEPGAVGHILSRQVLILRLSGSEICDPPILPNAPASLPEFRSRLLYLDFSMATVAKSSLTMLFSKCRRLKKVSLEHVAVDDRVLEELSLNQELEVLNLAMVEGITRTGLTFLLPNVWKLKELNVSWTGLKSTCIEYLCSHLPPTLDRLNLSGCRQQIDDDNILELVASCPNLRELDLSDCTGLTSRTIHCLTNLKGLNFLALSRCYYISHRSILLLKSIKSLTYLDMYGGHIEGEEFEEVQNHLGPTVNINKFKFSSVARPTVGLSRSSIWGLRVRD